MFQKYHKYLYDDKENEERAKISLKIAGNEQLYQVKRMIGGIGNMLFSIFSQT